MEAFEKLKKEESIYITDGNRPAEIIAKDIWQEVSKITSPDAFHT
jgi:hypothetical protein